MFIGNLFSTSWKIKTKSEPLISVCATRTLIKSGVEYSWWTLFKKAVFGTPYLWLVGWLDTDWTSLFKLFLSKLAKLQLDPVT